jgi:hypothetical protein
VVSVSVSVVEVDSVLPANPAAPSSARSGYSPATIFELRVSYRFRLYEASRKTGWFAAMRRMSLSGDFALTPSKKMPTSAFQRLR